MTVHQCPRCGEHKLEFMKSYSFCWECGYSPSDEQISPMPFDRKKVVKESQTLTSKQHEEAEALAS